MVEFKLSLGEGAFPEATLTVAKLAIDVITPEEKCSIVKRSHTVAFATRNVGDMKGSLLRVHSIIKLGQILNERPVV